MFKRDQKVHYFIKGTLKNKRKQKKNRKQNDTKIEIEINENQINNTNYDVQSYNDDEAANSKRINDKKGFDENQDVKLENYEYVERGALFCVICYLDTFSGI